MKTKALKWMMAVFGIGLVAFFACEPDPEYKDPNDDKPQPGPVTDTVNQDTISSFLEFDVLYSGTRFESFWEDYSRFCVNQSGYENMYRQLISWTGSPEEVDFTRYSVLAVVDAVRPYPTYQLRVSEIMDQGDSVLVYVARDVHFGEGGPAQAYVVVRMPKVDKPLRIVDLPFETDVENPDYMPQMGVSDCLDMPMGLAKGQETLWFKFTENGKLVFEHRRMELNCAETLVEISGEQDGLQLSITMEERLGPDSMMAMCVCAKNVGYGLDVAGGTDSLEVNYRWTTFDRGLRTRTFKIPGHGSGEIYIGENLW